MQLPDVIYLMRFMNRTTGYEILCGGYYDWSGQSI